VTSKPRLRLLDVEQTVVVNQWGREPPRASLLFFSSSVSGDHADLSAPMQSPLPYELGVYEGRRVT